ncbi:RNI-like protein [Lindgomyces ingoldianus]|uniref:RNI-like protein n=1 Tax=Lindgomyces ingoldianus TaxID=673940 RepID=A0ACB6QTF7_9PLEO|nr:RNI-like protein [Lindgomyces ingoldianus]KAF2470132.1 RNI-like protein [Lindgomyces ingoldianus]
MEDIHGVDVSWLHHSNRGEQLTLGTPHLSGRRNDHHNHHRQQAPSSPGLTRDAPPRTSAHGCLPPEPPHEERKAPEPAAAVQKPSFTLPPPPSTPPVAKMPLKRPALLSRGSSEKAVALTTPDGKSSLRRNSWISSISSKFSSMQNSPAQTTHAQAQGSPASANGAHGPTSSANGALNGIQAASGGGHVGLEPYVPQQPKSSFISNALRRLSSGSQVGTMGKVTPQGGMCPRRVMNVDPNRSRCLVPELDQNKLRRVAFCVDVEIAGGPRYKDDADCEEKKKKRKERKLKERGEGEALKNPEMLAEEKEQADVVKVNTVQEVDGNHDAPNQDGVLLDDEKKEPSKKKEKKKRSEAERKERKEKKRRRAEENGSVPLELTREDDDRSPDGAPAVSGTTSPRPQDRPTTDPLRIYRRCCQLRETPILKRIVDQLSAPKACSIVTPGVVICLDLTGSRLQLADVVTLSDWLAIVPVKKLFLEDADLTDEKVRVILAGLLAAKVPEPPKRRPFSSEKETNNAHIKTEERLGCVKKLVLKNNPKIALEGWKHISLFIYLCKSIQAIDVSMIPFPNSAPQLSPQTSDHSNGSTAPTTKPSRDVADTLSKAISERLGGSDLEELVMSECSLTASSIRKIIDGIVVSGVQRLGLAGNDIDNEGLGHVIHYLRSGVCQGIDLGGNDLRDGISRVAECLTRNSPLWALSLADCDLTPESLKILFPALVHLPTFRFLDLSHNRDLFSQQTSLCILRKYIPHLRELKRIHLMDVSLTPAEAIGLAEVLPECSHLAHISILENPRITAISIANDEASQEEAAALYASLMVAAKVSHTLIAIDVDVPGPDTSEVVKALAKQVVAYCLRNMESFSEIPELKPVQKEVEVPDVLMHLVGHTEGYSVNRDNDDPAPGNDYIVGGTGVVKALSYCLLQKATDLRRQSLPASGTITPQSQIGSNSDDSGKAKTMSKNLLESARNIRARLQPAMVREAKAGNDMGYRKLLFLDQTLQGMIQRFEDEYPETRLQSTDAASVHSSTPSTSPPTSTVPTLSTSITNAGQESDDDEPKALRSRHNSDVSLASRALSLEEGRLHRLGHRVRTEILNASRPPTPHSDQANLSGSLDHHELPDHLLALREKFQNYSGEELRAMTEDMGWEQAFDEIIANAEELRILERESPEEFRRFRESQIAALKNRDPEINGKGEEGKKDGGDDYAIEE